MSRLTRKDISGNYDLTYENGDFVRGIMPNEKVLGEIYINGMNKLGELEDLEDELGCPLDVVTSKTAMVVKDNGIYEVDIMAVSFTNGNIYFGSEWSFTTKKIKDYKKTWWLKEDLSE